MGAQHQLVTLTKGNEAEGTCMRMCSSRLRDDLVLCIFRAGHFQPRLQRGADAADGAASDAGPPHHLLQICR